MVVLCQRKEKVLSLSRGNMSNKLSKLLSRYLAVTWHLLIKDKFVVLCDVSQGSGQLVGSSSSCTSVFHLPARLAPSQHFWATTQIYLTETLTMSMQILALVTWSDSPTKHPGSEHLAGPCCGQKRSSPVSCWARGCFVIILLWKMPPKVEHLCVHASRWKESGSTITWNLPMKCCIYRGRQLWAVGHSECLLRCWFSKLTNCRALWVERQKLFHHECQCLGNCLSQPVHYWDSHLVIQTCQQ